MTRERIDDGGIIGLSLSLLYKVHLFIFMGSPPAGVIKLIVTHVKSGGL